ncbi:MAG: hypothetical protein NXI07_13375, partial [bacterium]|nr:hypothetical protein [bacterium]
MLPQHPHTIGTCLLAGSFMLCAPAAPTQAADDWTPADLAGDTPSGVLRYQILDAEGEPSPARLTFIAPDGSRPELFP